MLACSSSSVRRTDSGKRLTLITVHLRHQQFTILSDRVHTECSGMIILVNVVSRIKSQRPREWQSGSADFGILKTRTVSFSFTRGHVHVMFMHLTQNVMHAKMCLWHDYVFFFVHINSAPALQCGGKSLSNRVRPFCWSILDLQPD